MKEILCDSSSAILLFKSDLLLNLTQTYRVIMTASVLWELTRGNYPGAEAIRDLGRRSLIQELAGGRGEALLNPFRGAASLGAGERDTIAQYLSGRGAFILIDDGRAAAYCQDNSLPYINALLFPRILYLSGNILREDYLEKIEILIHIGRYSPKIIEYALNCSKDKLELFLP